MNILHIDDDAQTRIMFADILESKGFHCRGAESADVAMKLMHEQRFDLIFLDLRMPNGSGFDFIRDVRKKGFPTSNITLVTGMLIQEQDKNVLASYGIRNILRKPFAIEELFHIIDSAKVKKEIQLARIERKNRWKKIRLTSVHYQVCSDESKPIFIFKSFVVFFEQQLVFEKFL